MKKRILSTILSLCMVLTMLMSLLPTRVVAQKLTHLSHAGGQDTALRSVAVQSIGPNEAEVENDLYEKMSAQVSVIKLISDIELGGYLPIDYEVTIDLNGHVLKMADGTNGSVIKIGNTGDLTLIDSNPTAEHKFKVNGTDPWVLDETGGTKTVKGGVITGGTGYIGENGVYGGGVYIESGGKLTVTDGNIVGCTATGNNAFGGGVFVSKGGEFTMSGGSITGCTVTAQDSYGTAYGGGIRNHGFDSDVGHTTLSGTAVIRDCHAKGGSQLYGGGISDGGTLNISGDVMIIGCTADGNSDAMYVNGNDDSSITGGTFYGSIAGDRSKIHGITVTYRVNGADYATRVVQPGDTTGVSDPAKDKHIFDGWYKADGTKWDTTTPVTENLTLSGWLYKGVGTADEFTAALNDSSVDVIRLMNDITIDTRGSLKVIRDNRQLTLDLNGYVLDLKKDAIRVGGGTGNKGSMTIVDSRPQEEHKFKDDGTGLWVLDDSGDKIVKGGVITGSDSSSSSNISVGGGGTVIMNGGNIVGHKTSENGGAVSITTSGRFTMNGGRIMGCTAKKNGGGVAVFGGTFTMTGGSIADCKDANGSGVYLSGSMNAGGGMVDGTVELDADGVITGGGSTFSGLIINNNAQAQFSGAHSPLGIVGEKPTGVNGHNYCTVTFDPADGTMEHTTRYFLRGKNISDQIVPDFRVGYFFDGWYNSENKWNHDSDTVTADMTLTARWTACDHSGHTGAQPDCTTSVICTACGGTIGALGHDFSVQEHNNDEHWKKCSRCDATDGMSEHDWDAGKVTIPATCTTSGEKKYTCTECDFEKTETIDAKGHHYGEEWQHDATHHWHLCSNCDAKKSYDAHSGGKATCKDKAVCEVCAKAYCELDVSNHSDLKHINAKAATKDAEGNIEYWYCDGCGKYYSDAAGTKEITRAAIVTAKLPEEPKSPQTGENSGLWLWIALLFVSGGVVTGGAVFGKKKKHSAG